MTEEDLKFNKSTSMWKGRMLKDMTRDELIDAFWELGQLYGNSLDQRKRDLDYNFSSRGE